ncbi:MAG: hypothetical protein K1X57_05130 [Gemmataceae bacterium]|nr:hypothetical protein [Gemmataceae bacterium]
MAVQPLAPEPKFWSKYSPHQELPISGLSSAAIHVGCAVLLVLLLNFVIGGGRDPGMPLEVFDEGTINAGGGGDPNGKAVSNVPGSGRVERADTEELPADTPKANAALGGLPDVRDTLPDLPANPLSDRTVDSSAAKNQLDGVGKSAPKGPPQSAGRGGPGSGGGKGKGSGPGEGTGDQAGSQGSIRHKRNKRWTLSFNTNGDYLRQLSALGAILVAEYPDGTRVMFRKLDQSPVPPEVIDPDIRNRMVWVDERPSAVRELSEAMGVSRMPTAIKAYFPFKLENEMLKLELAYRGKQEEEIHSTVFRVLMDGRRYRLVVEEQRYN